MFMHFAATGIGHSVEAQIILVEFNLGQQSALKIFHFCHIYLAFEHRFLHSLSGTLADPSNAPKAAAPLACFGIHIVADDNEHAYFGQNGR